LLTVPEGNDEEVIVRVAGGAAATTIDIAADFVWTGLPLSVTVAVNLDVPLAVGVPEIAPLLTDKLRPAGRLPVLIDHVYGAVPPLAWGEPE
jgi:hypothetical protein